MFNLLTINCDTCREMPFSVKTVDGYKLDFCIYCNDLKKQEPTE